jgi:nucleoside-diphosphate-sugar epimerase
MIVITGATGQTGSKITNLLLKKEQKIRVIARSENKLKPFKEKGAEIAVGDQSDVRFLTGAFSNSDAVYLLIPPKMDAPDIRAYYNSLGDIAIKALLDSGVKKVVLLSSIGAELTSGTGPVPCIQVSISDALKSMTDMGLSENFATSLIEMSTTIGNGTVKPSTIDPFKPNTDTRFGMGTLVPRAKMY